MRPSWIEVDLVAIRHNVALLRRAVAPAELCVVVKADAYGHGDVPVAEAALGAGADLLAVALVEEGIRLREAGIEGTILLLSEPPVEDAREIVEWDLTATVYTRGFATALADAAGASRTPVHLKLDTGMHRVGADRREALELAALVEGAPELHLAGLWTHFASAEEDEEFTTAQTKDLVSLRDELADRGVAVPAVHAANTAGALMVPGTRLDMVRVGLATYGLRPHRTTAPDLDLRPAMRVVSRVSLVRRLPAGARPSYGRRRPLERDSTVATVPIGYADGVARRLSSVGGEVLIGGARRPYAGTVTMDQIVVDVGDDPVSVGDEVVLLGSQGAASITAEDWAAWLDTINYEIVCDFGPRLPRHYLDGADA